MDSNLIFRAQAIRGAQTNNFNSAERVGSLFEDILNYISSNEAAWLDKGSGEGTPSGMGGLINSLWQKANPAATDQILHWDGSKWEYITTPSGGTGGGISLSDVWNSLSNNIGEFASRQIHAGHLSSALSAYVPLTTRWWGQTINNGTVTGDLSGNINSITFGSGDNALVLSYDSTNSALKLSKGTNGEANFYATGGVSALGYSSSGSDEGGGGITPAGLNDILTSINSSDAAVQPSQLTNGTSIAYNGEKWVLRTQTLGNLMNVALSNPQNGQGLIYDASNAQWINGNVASQGGTKALSGLTDDTVINNPSAGQILSYSTSKWRNTNFSVTNSGITVGSQTYNFSNNQGTVKSVGLNAANTSGLTVSSSSANPITSNGVFTVGVADGYTIPSDTQIGNWNTAVGNVEALQGQMSTANNNISTLQSYFNGDKAKKAELADEAIKLQTSRYLWGNLFDGTADIGTRNTPATIDYVEDIRMTSEHPIIYMGGADIIDYNSRDDRSDLDIGFGKAVGDGGRINQTRLFGKSILIAPYDVDNKENKTALTAGIDNTADKNPYVLVGKTLRIGDANSYFPVIYDTEKNALCFSGDIYATGGVSALGFSSTANGGAQIAGNFTVNGDVSARNNLNVANGLTVSGNAKAKSLEVGTASLTINADSGDLEISGGEEGVSINTNFYVDSEGEVTTPSITSTNLKAKTISVGDNIKIDTTNGLQAKVGNTWYKLDIQAAIQAGLFIQVQ